MKAPVFQRFATSATSLVRPSAFAATVMRRLAFVTLFAAAPGAHAQLEGTLFTQPEERAYLDYLRDEFLRNSAEQGFDIEEAAIPVIPGEEAAAPSGPTEFSFGGIITRRDGSRSVWLNGVVLAEGALPAGMSLVSNDGSASLRIAHEGKIYVLRPGQTVDLAAGNVMENYQRPQPAAVDPAAAQQDDATEAAATAANADTATDADESAAAAGTGIADTVDALTSAVGALDDSQVAALFEALETLRPASPPEDEADEADAEEP